MNRSDDQQTRLGAHGERTQVVQGARGGRAAGQREEHSSWYVVVIMSYIRCSTNRTPCLASFLRSGDRIRDAEDAVCVPCHWVPQDRAAARERRGPRHRAIPGANQVP